MTADLAAATDFFRRFVDAAPREQTCLIFHDSDADGVSAGVVLFRTLERVGFSRTLLDFPTRERDAWSDMNRSRIASHSPATLFVLDLGSRTEPLLPTADTCFIDHHRPEGVPDGAVLITSYHWNPIPNTSLLVFDLCSAVAEVSDLAWIAALGTLSDIGDRAPFPLIARVKEQYKLQDLKEATTLINAARRASLYQPEVAVRALLEHSDPGELVRSTSEDVQRLRAAREEVNLELAKGKMAAPKFAGNVALVRVHSPCQIHPVIAQIWRTRLPKYVVMVANDGYLPDRVNFSMRSASGVNLLDFLNAIDLGDGDEIHAHGHDQATGGSLPVERWNRLLQKLGFSAEVFAA